MNIIFLMTSNDFVGSSEMRGHQIGEHLKTRDTMYHIIIENIQNYLKYQNL